MFRPVGELTINHFSVVRKSGSILGELDEIGIILHVDSAAHVFERSTRIDESLDLVAEIRQVVMEPTQLLFRSHLEVSGHERFRRTFQELLQHVNPVQYTAVVHGRRGVVHKQISRGHDALGGKVDEKVPRRVGFAGMEDLHSVLSHIELELMVEGESCTCLPH